MSESIDSVRLQLWEKMRSKKYRDTFVAAHLSTNIAAQIQTLREARKWTQKELADKAGMSQARISVMENPAYENFTFATLKRLASAFDVAFVARFEAFGALVDWVADISSEKLEVPSFEDDKPRTSGTGSALKGVSGSILDYPIHESTNLLRSSLLRSVPKQVLGGMSEHAIESRSASSIDQALLASRSQLEKQAVA